jgi:hypothetical protein
MNKNSVEWVMWDGSGTVKIKRVSDGRERSYPLTRPGAIWECVRMWPRLANDYGVSMRINPLYK